MTEDSKSSARPDDRMRQLYGQRLTTLRAAKGWNQSELGRRASEWLPGAENEVSRQMVSKYEKGAVWPGPAIRRAMAMALGVNEADVLPTSEQNRGVVSITDLATRAGYSALKVDVILPSDEAWRLGNQVKIALRDADAADKK